MFTTKNTYKKVLNIKDKVLDYSSIRMEAAKQILDRVGLSQKRKMVLDITRKKKC